MNMQAHDSAPSARLSAPYILNHGPDMLPADSREAAVTLAKELSTTSRDRVAVESQDGSVKMQFRDGMLETLAIQTRKD